MLFLSVFRSEINEKYIKISCKIASRSFRQHAVNNKCHPRVTTRGNNLNAYVPVDLETRPSCQIEIHFSIQIIKFLMRYNLSHEIVRKL